MIDFIGRNNRRAREAQLQQVRQESEVALLQARLRSADLEIASLRSRLSDACDEICQLGEEVAELGRRLDAAVPSDSQ